MMPDMSELKRDFIMDGERVPVRPLTDRAAGGRVEAVVAIGVFDGFHVGHRALIDATVADARSRGCRAVALTFDPDPDRVVSTHPARRLLSLADRMDALATSGVDEVLVIPFTHEVASLDHVAFFSDMVFPALSVASIHVGSDFRLGAGGASTVEVIRDWCSPLGIDVLGHDLVLDCGRPVSATRIRRNLAQGDLAAANHELGRRYLVRGTVTTGRGEGAGMGFPTANVRFDPEQQLPSDGVYAGLALVDGAVWPAAVNVGLPPMYRDRIGSASLEANLIGFTGDLYGRDIAIAFDERLRPSCTFPTVDALVEQVLRDIELTRDRFGSRGVRLA